MPRRPVPVKLDPALKESWIRSVEHARIRLAPRRVVPRRARAATRLASNTSPEPLTNIGLSLGEDAAVLGGLTLVSFSPLLALIIFLIAIGVSACSYEIVEKPFLALKAKTPSKLRNATLSRALQGIPEKNQPSATPLP